MNPIPGPPILIPILFPMNISLVCFIRKLLVCAWSDDAPGSEERSKFHKKQNGQKQNKGPTWVEVDSDNVDVSVSDLEDAPYVSSTESEYFPTPSKEFEHFQQNQRRKLMV